MMDRLILYLSIASLIGFLSGCGYNPHNGQIKGCPEHFLAVDSLQYIFSVDSTFVIFDSITACRLKWSTWFGGGDSEGRFFPAYSYEGIIYRMGRQVYSIPKAESTPFLFFDYNMKVGEEKAISFINNIYSYPEETEYTLKLENIFWDEDSQDSVFMFRFWHLGINNREMGAGDRKKWIESRDDYIMYSSFSRGIYGFCYGWKDESEDVVKSCTGKTEF